MTSSAQKFTIGRGTEQLGAFTSRELIAQYNSLLKCEGIWVEIGGQPQPLWNAVTKWHRAQSVEAQRDLELKEKGE